MQNDNNFSLLRLFLVMARIGAFTIGGGYAMILIIQKEITERGWISKEEFPDLIALAQAAPGLLAVNISIFAGYRMRGTIGAIVATLGSCLAPFTFILLIALFFSDYANNPYVQRVFAGMRPAVVALIAVPMVKMLKSGCRRWWQWAIMAAALMLCAFAGVSPIYILSVVIVCSFAVAYAIDRRARK